MTVEGRPSKKQRELLTFIDGFISQHGYGPSYREIMNGLGYRSVSTVATHVDNLIKKGHLRKRDYSARSLEVVESARKDFSAPKSATESQEKWLIELVTAKFAAIESNATRSQREIDDLYVLVGALHVLSLGDAARSFKARLLAMVKKQRAAEGASDSTKAK
jgi:SOS-response transcriptional repressor LexA